MEREIKFLISVIIILFSLLRISYAQYDLINGDEFTVEQIIDSNKSSLISVWYFSSAYSDYYSYSDKDTIILSGSGIIFDKRGLAATNFHVVSGKDSIFIKTSNGTFYNAELIYVEDKNDLAILKIIDSSESEFSTIQFDDSDNLKQGQVVYAVGSPLGFEYTISEGIIAAIRDNENVKFNDPYDYSIVERTFDRVIQMTAAISPGNSGGALFNNKGKVIGITTYTYGYYGNLNFAIGINVLKKLIEKINLADIDSNEEYKIKKINILFNTNFKNAENYASKLIYNWTYTRQADTMKTIDSFVIKQDSINKINFSRAEYHYKKCMEIKPDTFDIYQNLLRLYVNTDNFHKAENLYMEIREKFDSDSLINTLSSSLAHAYITSKSYDKALQFYNKMIKNDPNDIIPYIQLGIVYENMNKYDSAIIQYQKAIKIDSMATEPYVKIAKINYEIYKDYKKSKKILLKLLERELYTDNIIYDFDVHYYLGMIAVKEGKKMEAILAYIELKNIFGYDGNSIKKRIELYNAIRKMD